MNELIPNLLRAVITDVMLILLLSTMATPKYKSKWMYALVTAGILAVNISADAHFYLTANYTAVFYVDLVMLLVIGIALKPLFSDKIMPWCFSYITMLNIYAAVMIVSYLLCGVFPKPIYGNAWLRLLFFFVIVLVFRKWVSRLYRKVLDYWHIYILPILALLVCFLGYFFGSDILKQMESNYLPLALLILLGLSVYISIIHSLKTITEQYQLREENLKIQADRELTRQRLTLMDNAVGQMSTARHDQRHFNHTVVALLRQGENQQAIELLEQGSQFLQLRPAIYCENMSVNAAVSYYAEQAKRQGIQCDIRLNIPEKLSIDELSLAIAISNLMENAIIACTAVPENARVLRFTAVDNGQLLLEMTNPYMGKITLDKDGMPITSKDGHGWGSRSVAAFVKSFGGELLYELLDGIFRVRMIV